MRVINKVFMGMLTLVPLLCSFNYVPECWIDGQGYSEILSIRCDTNTLGYILGILENNGFTVLSISFIKNEPPLWNINYKVNSGEEHNRY